MNQHGWKIAYLNKKTGISRQALYNLADRPQSVQIETLGKLCGGIVQVRFNELLEEKGWTQGYVTENTGLAPSTVSRLCNNPLAIWMDTLGKLCSGLGVKPIELFSISVKGGQLIKLEELFEVEE